MTQAEQQSHYEHILRLCNFARRFADCPKTFGQDCSYISEDNILYCHVNRIYNKIARFLLVLLSSFCYVTGARSWESNYSSPIVTVFVI